VAFDDLNDKPREYLIAALAELNEGGHPQDARLGTVWNMATGRWSQTLGGRQVELPVTLDEATLAELVDASYILLVTDRVSVREYSFKKKAHDEYEIYLQPPTYSNAVPERLDFSFTADPDLRSMMERDYQEIPRCLATEGYKAATVMCGSVMEALLLDALLADEAKATQSAMSLKGSIGKVPNDLGKWTLKQMIAVAQDLQILPKEIGGMSEALREYRNLIHPAVGIRKQMRAEEEEATLAYSALRVIIKNLA
jgi:hypothetical protein